MTFPTGANNSVLYGAPIGAGTLTTTYRSVLLPVAQDCTVQNLHFILTGAPANQTISFNLMSYNQRDGLVFTGMACSITTDSSGSDSCTAPVQSVIYFQNVVAYSVSGFNFSEQPNVVTVTASFVCK